MKVFLFISIFFLVSCSEEVKTVEWYKEHTTERQKILKECEKKEQALMANSNCGNAKKAEASLRRMSGKMPKF